MAAASMRATEIVVTRGFYRSIFNTSAIAELREIEEIRINGFDPSASGSLAPAATQFR